MRNRIINKLRLLLAVGLGLAFAGCMAPEKDSPKTAKGVHVDPEIRETDFSALPGFSPVTTQEFSTETGVGTAFYELQTSGRALQTGGFDVGPNGGYALLINGNKIKTMDGEGKETGIITVDASSLGLTGFKAQAFLRTTMGRYVVAGVAGLRLVVLELADTGAILANYQEVMSAGNGAEALFTSILEVPPNATPLGRTTFALAGMDNMGRLKFMRLSASVADNDPLGLEWSKTVDLAGEAKAGFADRSVAGSAVPWKMIRDGQNLYFCGQFGYEITFTPPSPQLPFKLPGMRPIAGSLGLDGTVRWTRKWSEVLDGAGDAITGPYGAAYDLVYGEDGNLVLVGMTTKPPYYDLRNRSAYPPTLNITKLDTDGMTVKSVSYTGGPDASVYGGYGVVRHGGGYLACVRGSEIGRAGEVEAALVTFNASLEMTGLAIVDPTGNQALKSPLKLHSLDGAYYLLGGGRIKVFTIP